LAPIGSIPPAIDVDGLAIGIELDVSGIGDMVWLAAAEGCPDDEHAAASSASAPTPTAARKTEPGRDRPVDEDADMEDLLMRPHARTRAASKTVAMTPL